MPGEKRKASCTDGPLAKRIPTKSQEPPDRDFINILNDDCLSSIFQYLPIKDRFAIQGVCRRWRENRHLMWGDVRTLHFANSTDTSSSSLLGNNKFSDRILKESRDFLRKLKVENLYTGLILPPIMKYCHNLRRLEIKLPLMDINLYEWFPQMEQLEYLRVQARSYNFSNKFFNSLPHESLTELHLKVYFQRNDGRYTLPSASHSALKKLKKLSSLSLENFHLDPNVLMKINQMENLISLSLECCTGTKPLIPLNLPNLEHLNLMNVRRANDKFISHLSENCKNLKSLDLSVCHGLTDDGITELHKLSKLETLSLMGLKKITDKPLSTMYNLKMLNCVGAKNVKKEGITALVKNSHNLEKLILFQSGVDNGVSFQLHKIVERRMRDATV